MVRALIAAQVVGLCLAGAPSQALATPRDSRVTRAYLRAHYRFEQASKASISLERKAIAGLIGTIRSRCPHIAAGAPSNQAADAFAEEILVAVSDTALLRDHSAIVHFIDAVDHLRWSNPYITRATARYAARLKAELALKPPDLCSDLRQWASVAFGKTPANVTHSIHEAEAASVGPNGVPAQLLEPYMRASDRELIRHTDHVENEVRTTQLSIGLQATVQIVNAVGLKP